MAVRNSDTVRLPVGKEMLPATVLLGSAPEQPQSNTKARPRIVPFDVLALVSFTSAGGQRPLDGAQRSTVAECSVEPGEKSGETKQVDAECSGCDTGSLCSSG